MFCLVLGLLSSVDVHAQKVQDIKNLNEEGKKLTASDSYKAQEILLKAHKMAVNNSNDSLQMEIEKNLGITSFYKGDFNEAITWYRKSNELALQRADSAMNIKLLFNIGQAYSNLGDFEKAEQYYNETVKKFSSEHTDMNIIGNAYISLGVMKRRLGNSQDAISYFQKALIVMESSENMEGVAQSYVNLGNIYMDVNEFDAAKASLDSALAISKRVKSINGEVNSIRSLSEFLLLTGKCKEAVTLIKMGLKTAEERNMRPQRKEFYSKLKRAYECLDDFKQALYWQEKFTVLSDSLNKNAQLKEILKVENSALEKANLVNESTLRTQTLLIVINTVVFLLLIVFAYKFFKAKQQLNKEKTS